MENKRYRPLVDKVFWWILIPTLILLSVMTALAAAAPLALIIVLVADVFCLYFLFAPLVGYVELRENTLFIRYGCFLTREIPYERIRGLQRDRKFYSESMMSLKLALDHVNVRYNRFDVTALSVKGNEEFMEELSLRVRLSKERG